MIIVKVGGSEGIPEEKICADVAELAKQGESVVLIHGGSHETNVVSEKLGHPPRMVQSVSGIESRYTDERTMEIFCMVYAGKANKKYVSILQQMGVNAIGLSGADGKLWQGKRKPSIKIIENGKKKVLRGDYTGKVEAVNVELLQTIQKMGMVAVLTPPAISFEGELINVDGDRAAAMTASHLKADNLVIISNIPGLLKDVNDPSSLIKEIKRSEMDNYLDFAKGRMKKKLMGAAEAIDQGVKRVIIGDARLDNPLIKAMNGQGTVIS